MDYATSDEQSRRTFIKGSLAALAGVTLLGGGGGIYELVEGATAASERTWGVLWRLAKAIGLAVVTDEAVKAAEASAGQLISWFEGEPIPYKLQGKGYGIGGELAAITGVPMHSTAYTNLVWLFAPNGDHIDLLPRAAQALKVVATDVGADQAKKSLLPLQGALAGGPPQYAATRSVSWPTQAGTLTIDHVQLSGELAQEKVVVQGQGVWTFGLASDGINLASSKPIQVQRTR